MDTLDTFTIRHLLAPVPHRGVIGVLSVVAAAIAACEVRTMGMGLHRSDGRNAGIFDPLLVQLVHVLEVIVPVL